MKKTLIISFLCFTIFKTFAQDGSVKDMQATTTKKVETKDDKERKNGWTTGGLFSLNLTQIGNSNWVAAGGDKFTLSLATSLNAFAIKKWGNKTWQNVLDVNYALVNTTTLGVRKVNDRIDYLSKLTLEPKNWKNVSLASLVQFRSQLTSGYEYDYFGTDTKRRNSGFFAPAYITVAPIGIDWHPKEYFSVFVSPAVARWTIVSNGPYSYAGQGGVFNGNVEKPLASLYGVNPVDENRGEFGAFLTASFKKEIMKNVNYYSKLDLYSNYLKKPQNVDMFWTNQFKLQVNKWIQVNYTLDMLYDDDVKQADTPANLGPRAVGLQVLSTLGVGFSAKF